MGNAISEKRDQLQGQPKSLGVAGCVFYSRGSYLNSWGAYDYDR